jgi:serine/threonine protein kinase
LLSVHPIPRRATAGGNIQATSALEFETIGKYKILGEIGRGAMGVVYKAHDTVLNRLVAVKTIAPSLQSGTEAGKRFLREAQSAARLNHPNIVTVYDLGEVNGRAYLAMELLQGKDLRQLMGTPALVHLEDKLRIMEQVCEGVAFAHAKDVVHRDLKPANIHVQPNGSVKIMDFGLARIGGASEMTATGTSLGTPNYMSPEQVRGAKADLRSDVFSLGAVFYEMLTNQKAFDADSVHSILRRVTDSEPAPARRWDPDLPAILERLLQRALDKDPARRFRNAGEMRLALAVADQVLGGQLEESEGLALLEPSEAETTAIMEAPPTSGSALVGRSGGPRTEHTARDLLRRGATLTRAATQTRLKTGIGRGSSLTNKGSKAGPAETLPPVRVDVAPSRASVYVGAGAALLLILGGAFWVWRGRAQGPPSPPSNIREEQVGALTEALATSQVELAQESLKDKDYSRAVSQAGQALKLEPQNAEAKQILDKVSALLKEVDEAASLARAAVQEGDTATASRALARVLAIDPNHPVAGELSAKLNQYFRGQAEEARTKLEEARLAAERGKAGFLAPFAEAAAAAREAERLFTGAQFAVATRKFIEGRDGFARALRLAEAQQAAARTPPTTAVASTSARSPYPQPFTPPIAAPTPTAATTASLAPSAPPSLAILSRPTTTALGGAAEEATVRKTVDDFARAIQARDIELYRAVKPNLSAEDEKRLRAIFKQYKSYKVTVVVNSIQFEGTEAKVRVSRQDTIDGSPIRLQQLLTMTRGPSGWTIREIGQ